MKKKILTILPLFLVLTGCQKSYFPFSMADMTTSISYGIHCFLFSILQFMNKVVCGFYNFVYYIFAKTMTPSDSWIISEMDYYTKAFTGKNGAFITTVSVLACGYILINFAIGIYKNNFATANNQYAPTAADLIKKVITALVLTFAIPYICITGFSLASRLGTKAVANIKTDQQVRYQIYDFMKTADIDYNTVCNRSNRLEVSIDENNSDGILSKSFSGKTSVTQWDSSTNTSKTTNESFSTLYSQFNYSGDDYGFWCGTTGDDKDNYVSVGENMMNNEMFDSISPTTNFSFFGATAGSVATGIFIVPIVLATAIILAILAWVVLSSFAKRTADVVMLIAMSWYYIGASVADTGKENHLGEMFKKLLSLCISQFFFMVEVGLMIQFEGLTSGIFWMLAWIMVLTATPTVVEEMVGSTGTTEAMAGFSKKIWQGFKNTSSSEM